MKRFAEHLDIVLALIGGSAAYTLLFFDLIPETRAAKFGLLLLVSLTFFSLTRSFVTERAFRRIESRIDAQRVTLAHSFSGLTVARVFRGNAEYYKLGKLLITPSSEVCVTTFSDFVKVDELPGVEVQEFFEMISLYTKSSPSFRFWRIAHISNQRKYNWIRRTIEDARPAPGYHVAWLDLDLGKYPLMNMSIVDSRHVFLFGRHEIAEEPSFIYLDSEHVAAVARKMFDEWWRASVKLKEGSTIHWKRLDELRARVVD